MLWSSTYTANMYGTEVEIELQLQIEIELELELEQVQSVCEIFEQVSMHH